MDLVDIFESGIALSEFAYDDAEYNSDRKSTRLNSSHRT